MHILLYYHLKTRCHNNCFFPTSLLFNEVRLLNNFIFNYTTDFFYIRLLTERNKHCSWSLSWNFLSHESLSFVTWEVGQMLRREAGRGFQLSYHLCLEHWGSFHVLIRHLWEALPPLRDQGLRLCWRKQLQENDGRHHSSQKWRDGTHFGKGKKWLSLASSYRTEF